MDPPVTHVLEVARLGCLLDQRGGLPKERCSSCACMQCKCRSHGHNGVTSYMCVCSIRGRTGGVDKGIRLAVLDDGSGEGFIASVLANGQRLAGQRRLVDLDLVALGQLQLILKKKTVRARAPKRRQSALGRYVRVQAAIEPFALMSAGMMSPMRTRMMSPGTSSAAGSVLNVPLRRT